MTLRGEIESFPLETVVQLVHSTNKTGQLEVRGTDMSGTLGFDGGRLVAAIAGDDVGEPALGLVFAIQNGAFEFVPWRDAPASNLSGDLDQLLDRAAEERDRIVAIRKVIPDDRSRFRLSERAAERGDITLSPEQWRTLLAVNGERDLSGVAEHLKAGTLATRASLAALVESGFVDVLEPAAAPAPPPEPPAAPEQWSPPTPTEWGAPAPAHDAPAWAPAPAPEPAREPAPAPAPAWATALPTQDWERPAPAEPDLRADLAAALDARLSAPPAEPEPPAAPAQAEMPPTELPRAEMAPAQDERLAALSGVFGPPEPAPEAPLAPEAAPTDRINEWSRLAAGMQAEAPAPEEKKKGRFGFLKRDEPPRAEATPQDRAAPAIATAAATGRAGQLASLANAMLGEYNSGQYGKGRLDDRMANLLMRVDEQADPIDRPLPIVDDRIDVQALDRENMPEQQAVPYLAILVSQIYEDAERTFGKDKAKKGYRASLLPVFGADTSALSAPDVAGRLPRV